MPTLALVSAPLILGAVFVASAVGKLASPRRAAQAFDALHVPRALARPWMRAAHPWGELLLVLVLLVAWGPVAWAAAVVAVALCAFYLVLVVGAWRRPEPTDCACFGGSGGEPVTGWTVVRNVWLLAVAGACVAAALDPRSPWQRLLDLGPEAAWLLAVVAAAVTTALVVRRGEVSTPTSVAVAGAGTDAEPSDEYVRTPIPHVPVSLPNGGTISLRRLAEHRPQLLLAVSSTCFSCLETIAAAPGWRERLPEVDVRLLHAQPPPRQPGQTDPPEIAEEDRHNLYDLERFAYDALDFHGTPSAVLLGADGLLAGGPVASHEEISEFVAQVEAELATMRAAAHQPA